jgi:hypothetical protein
MLQRLKDAPSGNLSASRNLSWRVDIRGFDKNSQKRREADIWWRIQAYTVDKYWREVRKRYLLHLQKSKIQKSYPLTPLHPAILFDARRTQNADASNCNHLPPSTFHLPLVLPISPPLPPSNPRDARR